MSTRGSKACSDWSAMVMANSSYWTYLSGQFRCSDLVARKLDGGAW